MVLVYHSHNPQTIPRSSTRTKNKFRYYLKGFYA
ncbi:hypothetical protein SLEP1_g21847 [Rubroshorea leprosula]|uniref:Uncharacterized protein n=1 Tax=Rubroshorea leprosula TaxID=152421 RepID=A0AAV5JAF5_9ROSI|nr:hypothetical protein SLEP1_g21847 [Rubroshorea leprosula]